MFAVRIFAVVYTLTLAENILLKRWAEVPIPQDKSALGMILLECVVTPVTARVPAMVTAEVAPEKEEVPVPWTVRFPVAVVLPWVTTSPKLVMVGISN
jgi:hypothetical protein